MTSGKRIGIGGLALVAAVGLGVWGYNAFSGSEGDDNENGNGAAPGGSGMQAPVETLVINSRPLTRERTFNGSMVARESTELRVERSGRVSAIHFEDGDYVTEGDLLLEIDPRELRAELRAVEEELALAELNESRVAALYRTNAIPQRERDEAVSRRNVLQAQTETIRTRIEQMRVKAPFDGMLGIRRVSLGAFLDPGTVITTLDSTDPILVDFVVPEALRRDLSRGMDVRVRVAGIDDEIHGKISLVERRVDPMTRTVTARAKLPNPDGLLAPGTFAAVSVETVIEDAIVIPSVAVVRGLADVSVFVVNGESAERRTVRVGVRRDDSVQIIDGLSSGEEIVVVGTQQVRPGVGLNILERSEQNSEEGD